MKAVAVALALVAGPSQFVRAADNGKALTPPLGWRSWNLYAGNVNQNLMVSIMAGMVDRKHTVNGVPTSLKDLGYNDVGLDDNWQLCGSYGPNKYTYHNESGIPQVNLQRFPDFNNMTSYAHSLGLTAGWYGNNCICSDKCSTDACYAGDAAATVAYGFDSTKLDGCGAEKDLFKFYALFNASGKQILIENCHWGSVQPAFPSDNNPANCPYNYYRTSGDVSANWNSVMNNLKTVFPHAEAGVSYPGCWGYPDMLEVGVRYGQRNSLSFIESRSHFNAWAIVSSPLILSHDINNDTLTAAIWPIIANTEALAVNQAWAGFSGSEFPSTGNTNALYLYKPVNSTTTAVLLINTGASTQTYSLTFSTIPKLPAPGPNGYKVRDINAHADVGTFSTSYSPPAVAAHDAPFLLVTAA